MLDLLLHLSCGLNTVQCASKPQAIFVALIELSLTRK